MHWRNNRPQRSHLATDFHVKRFRTAPLASAARRFTARPPGLALFAVAVMPVWNLLRLRFPPDRGVVFLPGCSCWSASIAQGGANSAEGWAPAS